MISQDLGMSKKVASGKDSLRLRVIEIKRKHKGPYLESFMAAYPEHNNWRGTVKLMNVMSMRSLDEEFIELLEILYDITPETDP